MGIPTASIIGSGFLKQAEVIRKGLAIPLAIGVYPGPPMLDSEAELKRKVDESLAPGLLEGLTGESPREVETQTEPAPGDVVFRGTFDEIQEHFYRQLWTDGLPIVPPTRERVDAFFAYTDRKPDEVIRMVAQEGREASLLSIAVNGVMSGCRPEYMPLLIAVIEAMCDPIYRIEDSGSTPGWEPVVIVSGPIIKELDFNHGQGMMRIGRQANSSVGRFVRMFLRNVCGFRIPPGAGDKGSIAQSFLVAMAEDEDAVRKMGWTTFAQDRGFAAGENVVTVHSVVAVTSPIYSSGDKAIDHVNQWADVMGNCFSYWAHTGFKTGLWNPLIVAGPGIAEVVAREMTKDQVRHHIRERVKMTAALATHYACMTSTPTFSLENLVAEGILAPEYAASKDPQRMINVIIKPEMVEILVAGDPDRNQSRGYMSNHIQGPPVSRKIELPRDWAQRLKRG